MNRTEHRTYVCNPAIQWVVEKDFLILMGAKKQEIIKLQYPDAALWDFISREYPLKKILNMMTALRCADQVENEKWLDHTIESWLQHKLIIESDICG